MAGVDGATGSRWLRAGTYLDVDKHVDHANSDAVFKEILEALSQYVLGQ
jgi:hypothetical protein